METGRITNIADAGLAHGERIEGAMADAEAAMVAQHGLRPHLREIEEGRRIHDAFAGMYGEGPIASQPIELPVSHEQNLA